MHLEADIAEVPWDHHARVPDVPFLEWASNCGSGALIAVVKEREHECRAQKLKVWQYRDDTSRCQTLLLMHPEDEVKSGRVRDILFEAEFKVLIVNLSFCIKTFAVDSSGVLVPQSAIPYRKPNAGGETAFATHGGFLFFADASGLVAWSLRALGGGGDDADAGPKPLAEEGQGPQLRGVRPLRPREEPDLRGVQGRPLLRPGLPEGGLEESQATLPRAPRGEGGEAIS